MYIHNLKFQGYLFNNIDKNCNIIKAYYLMRSNIFIICLI